jgi:D-alanine-D-alanine ligase
MKNKHVGMLMGGHNSEHEVSMRTGAALAKALRSRGYRVTEIDVTPKLPEVLVREGIEVAFVALHGRFGEDGCIQGLLEAMQIPYTGSGVLASALSMDKVFAKKVFRQSQLPVVEDVVLPRNSVKECLASDLPFSLPVVVKPSREGSSVGVNIAHDAREFQSALLEARKHEGDILIERYIQGREIQVGVLDDEAIGVIEVVPGEEFYNYKAKYQSNGKTQYLFPAPLNPQENQKALTLGLFAHRSLGCVGVSRVDTILSKDGHFFLLEVNAIPGMTEQSLIPKIAKGIGLSFEDLAERLLLGASLKA